MCTVQLAISRNWCATHCTNALLCVLLCLEWVAVKSNNKWKLKRYLNRCASTWIMIIKKANCRASSKVYRARAQKWSNMFVHVLACWCIVCCVFILKCLVMLYCCLASSLLPSEELGTTTVWCCQAVRNVFESKSALRWRLLRTVCNLHLTRSRPASPSSVQCYYCVTRWSVKDLLCIDKNCLR